MNPPENDKASPAWLIRSDRLTGALAILLAMMSIGFAIALLSLNRLQADVLREVARTRAARVAVYTLLQASVDAETGQRGFLLTGDETFLAPYEGARAAAQAQLTTLRGLSEERPILLGQVDSAERLAASAFENLAATITSYRAGALPPSELRMSLRASKAHMDALRAEVADMLGLVEGLVDAARASERTTREVLYWLGGVLALMTLAAAILALFALRRERRAWTAALTALSQANAAAEEARAAAAASDLAKTRFLAVASHDMRQPLHALTLYLSALERRVESSEARDIVAKMERATRSMVGMFATLLDLARVQAGVVQPDVTEFALQDVLDRIGAEHPDGVYEAPPTSLAIRSDPLLLERILRNLVVNAMKHGGGKTWIEIEARDGYADIAVRDQGPGIAAADRERIFDEFVRLEGRGGEGLGLGLAIVRKIADLLDVHIRVESEPGQGARFVVRAPLAGNASTAAAPTPTPTVTLTGASVIVMDDDALAREAIANALRDFGADVCACANEAELDALLDRGLRPGLLVLDLRIDGEMRGVDIANRARARLDPPPPAIIVTGDTAADTLADLRASGHAWLIKPVDPAVLGAAAAEQLHAA